jgi:hypothetical protein
MRKYLTIISLILVMLLVFGNISCNTTSSTATTTSTTIAGWSEGTTTPIPFTVQTVWNTFLGGSSDDRGNAIATDSNGNIYVAGDSDATWGWPQRAFSGNEDVLIAKIDNPYAD